VALDRHHRLVVQRRAVPGHPKRTVVHVPSGAAGDLRQLGGPQPAREAAVELAVRGEEHVVDVHVQAHADRIGGHQIVDLALLIHLHLGVPGPRAQRPHHHRHPAPLSAHDLGDRIDIGGGERDHRTAARQSGHLAQAGIGQLGQPRPGLEPGVRHQALEQRPDGLRAEQHGLAEAAGVHQPVGEDVPALLIPGQLDLVHRQEFEPPIQRHRFNGADEVPCVRRDDLLLAGDQGDGADSLAGNDLVVVLARQKTQRKSDHAVAVTEHALDR
jgi:hypothetical protein